MNLENIFEIHQISSSTWNDFVSLMQTDSQCSECWCLNHRELHGCPTGLKAQQKMNQLVNQNHAHGLLAYDNQNAIGWIAVDPMSALVGHDCISTAEPDEWSIHCLFVKDGFRGKGISVLLIKSAIKYAKERKAKLVSAFPIPLENRNKFLPNEAEFSGRFSTYVKMGFQSVGKSSEFYQRMEIEF